MRLTKTIREEIPEYAELKIVLGHEHSETTVRIIPGQNLIRIEDGDHYILINIDNISEPKINSKRLPDS